MQKLIEVSAAKEFVSTFLADPILKMAVNAVLDNCPAAEEVVPVEHGRWIIVEKPYLEDGCNCHLICSVCGRIVHNVDNPQKAIEYRPYCHCGAKMDGGENHGDN